MRWVEVERSSRKTGASCQELLAVASLLQGLAPTACTRHRSANNLLGQPAGRPTIWLGAPFPLLLPLTGRVTSWLAEYPLSHPHPHSLTGRATSWLGAPSYPKLATGRRASSRTSSS